jgi:hypothetical protein
MQGMAQPRLIREFGNRKPNRLTFAEQFDIRLVNSTTRREFS